MVPRLGARSDPIELVTDTGPPVKLASISTISAAAALAHDWRVLLAVAAGIALRGFPGWVREMADAWDNVDQTAATIRDRHAARGSAPNSQDPGHSPVSSRSTDRAGNT